MSDNKKRQGPKGPGGQQEDARRKRQRLIVAYIAIAAIGVFFLQAAIERAQQVEQLPYSEFLTQLEEGNIASATVSRERVTGEFESAVDGKSEFVTRRVDPEVVSRLREAGVEFDGTIENSIFDQILSWLIPIGIFVALWFFLVRRMAQQGGMGGGMMQVGRSKAKVYVEEETGKTFDDVAGIDESEEELREIVDFLRDPKAFGRLGAHVPKGVLLAGPPGTGKTLIARAVAGEAAVPFFYVNGSEFVEMFVGVGAARVRDLFNQAREKGPAIIFVDELDALGAKRGGGLASGGGGNDEKEQTLNQLLVELDGFDPTEGVVVIGATNRPEVLDEALLRAGRFDRRVVVNRPDRPGREAILRVHVRKIVPSDDLDLGRLAELTPGFSGADLENLVNEAALLATRRGADAVEEGDFTAAIERLVAGPEKKNQVMSEDERVRVAYHELGHALVAMQVPGADPVQKVSIVPRTVGALGYTLQRPTGDRYLMTRGELMNKMCVLLAGRAAERIFFDDVSTGAQDDLRKVSQIARSIVTQYGMSEELGLLAYETGEEGQGLLGPQRNYSDETARAIDDTARTLIDGAYDRAIALIREREGKMHETARQLLDAETMSEDRLRVLFGLDDTGAEAAPARATG